MFYLMVSGLNNNYEFSRGDEIIPYDDPGSQIVINMVEYRHPSTIGNIIPSHVHHTV